MGSFFFPFFQVSRVLLEYWNYPGPTRLSPFSVRYRTVFCWEVFIKAACFLWCERKSQGAVPYALAEVVSKPRILTARTGTDRQRGVRAGMMFLQPYLSLSLPPYVHRWVTACARNLSVRCSKQSAAYFGERIEEESAARTKAWQLFGDIVQEVIGKPPPCIRRAVCKRSRLFCI